MASPAGDENGWLYSTQVAAPSGAGIGLGRHPRHGHLRESPPMRLASPAGMKMGGRSRGLCRASGTRLGLCRPCGTGLGLCDCDDARRAMGTDFVSGRSRRNRSTRNQQLTEAFSKESPMRPRLTRRDEMGGRSRGLCLPPGFAGLVPPGQRSARDGDGPRFGALQSEPLDEESTTCAGIFERASPHPPGMKMGVGWKGEGAGSREPPRLGEPPREPPHGGRRAVGADEIKDRRGHFSRENTV